MNILISDVGIFKTEKNAYPISNASSVSRIDNIKKTDYSTQSVARDAQRAYVAENTPAYNISISSQGIAAIKSLATMKNSINTVNANIETANKNNISFGLNENKDSLFNINSKDAKYSSTGNISSRGIGSSAPSISSLFNANRDSVSINENNFNNFNVNNNISDSFTDINNEEVVEEDNIYAVETEDEKDTYFDDEAYELNGNEVKEDSVPYSLFTKETQGLFKISELKSNLFTSNGNEKDFVQPLEDSEQTVKAYEMNTQQNAPAMKQAVAAYNFQMAYQVNSLITQ